MLLSNHFAGSKDAAAPIEGLDLANNGTQIVTAMLSWN